MIRAMKASVTVRNTIVDSYMVVYDVTPTQDLRDKLDTLVTALGAISTTMTAVDATEFAAEIALADLQISVVAGWKDW